MDDERRAEGPETEESQGALFGAPAVPARGAVSAYQVLARKYRPQTFSDLIGQEALVRTLTNAFALGRVAHAFMLTGVRGVGKTTTARIIAKGLNCVGPDGTGGPTVSPCGVCANCTAIAASRHIDVFEMDAASRTGIDDIREIIEGARLLPMQARKKVYIIDEVHMLSKAAFNGLLKTLEEPPPHVVFVFATTEIRKVPVTVLSRCQRFDLRRVETARLSAHLARIVEAEGARAEAPALALIARAAEGSVRDGLSLLDQALARDEAAGAGTVREADMRDMLGLADGVRTLELLEAAFAGRAAEGLGLLEAQVAAGADPQLVITDLLDLVHSLTRVKIAGREALDAGLGAEIVARLGALAGSLPLGGLSRAWQMLLKGLSEVREAPQPAKAAEMVVIRLAFAADLLTPDEALRRAGPVAGASVTAPANGPSPARADAPDVAEDVAPPLHGGHGGGAAPARAAAPRSVPAREPRLAASPLTLEGLAALAAAQRDVRLKTEIEDYLGLVDLAPGRLAFRPAPGAPSDLAGRLTAALQRWTGERWVVSVVSDAPARRTLSEERRLREDALMAEVRAHPLVEAALGVFPGATIRGVRDLGRGAEDGLSAGGAFDTLADGEADDGESDE